MSDMQNEKDYFYCYNVFVHNHDFEKAFQKVVDALLEYDVSDNNLRLYIVPVNKFLLLVYVYVKVLNLFVERVLVFCLIHTNRSFHQKLIY